SGIIRYAIEKKRFHEDYVKLHTNAPYVIGEKFQFTDGLFSGFDQTKAEYDKNAWQYQPDPKTNAYMVDETLQNPRCVFQLLKQHVSRYTPEMVEQICGTPKDQFVKVAPGYLKTPTGATQTLAEYLEKGPPTTLNKQAWSSMNYWQNYPKFMVSLLKAYYGKTATKENDYQFALMPEVDGNYSWMYLFDDRYRGGSTRAGGEEPGPEVVISFDRSSHGGGRSATNVE